MITLYLAPPVFGSDAQRAEYVVVEVSADESG